MHKTISIPYPRKYPIKWDFCKFARSSQEHQYDQTPWIISINETSNGSCTPKESTADWAINLMHGRCASRVLDSQETLYAIDSPMYFSNSQALHHW